jgi:hypothetical protein
MVFATIIPTDDILLNNSTARSTSSTAFTKLKETRVYFNGTIRTYFELASGTSGQTVHGQVYRSGAAVGTDRSTTSTTYVSFTEDIAGWFAGDYYQIYGHSESSTVYCYVRNQQIRGVLTTQKPIAFVIL